MSEEHQKDTVDVVEEDATEVATEAAASALTALSIQSNTEMTDCEDSAFEIPERFTKSGRKKAVPFPVKLMKVLSDKKFNDVISWTPSGKSFAVLDAKEFTAGILPDHFKSAKFSSFTRKLHRWGFTRHYRGEEAGAFFHKDFQKDRLDLAEKMTCKNEVPMAKSTSAIASLKNIPQPPVLPRLLPESRLPLRAALPKIQANIPLTSTVQTMATSHLDAAIEAEVSRRVQERLHQAALSRMFMQQQLNTNVVPLALRLQLIEMQQKKLGAFGGPLVPLMRSRNPSASETGMQQLPRSNVQGAKTA